MAVLRGHGRPLHRVVPSQRCTPAHRHQALRTSLARVGSFQSGTLGR